MGPRLAVSFTKDALALVARSSEGFIRKARNIAISCLIEAVRDQTKTVDIKQVNQVLIQPEKLPPRPNHSPLHHSGLFPFYLGKQNRQLLRWQKVRDNYRPGPPVDAIDRRKHL